MCAHAREVPAAQAFSLWQTRRVREQWWSPGCADFGEPFQPSLWSVVGIHPVNREIACVLQALWSINIPPQIIFLGKKIKARKGILSSQSPSGHVFDTNFNYAIAKIECLPKGAAYLSLGSASRAHLTGGQSLGSRLGRSSGLVGGISVNAAASECHQ